MRLTLKQANTICEKALEHARAKNYAKLTIVVLDEAGNLKAAQRRPLSCHIGVEGKDDRPRVPLEQLNLPIGQGRAK